MKRRSLLQAALLAPALAQAQAQSYPSKPIRYIVPVAAGGGSDMVGRTVTDRWGKLLGQSFIVDNQGGGGGVIACQNTAKSAPDGYTLMQGYVATHGTSPATRKLPYDPIKDFTPVGMIGGTPNVLVVNAALPVKLKLPFQISWLTVESVIAVASRVVPALMVSRVVMMPSAAALLILSVPALRFTPPAKVFAPLRVRVPAPVLVRVPL